MLRLVVPDDAPPVLARSPSFQTLHEFAEVDYFDSLPGAESALIERIRDADIVINIRSSSRFTARVFESCPRLQLVSIWGTGTDNIDLAAAVRHGVAITNTPGVSASSVAEHTLALMLAVAHRISAQDAAVRRGEWPRGDAFALKGKTLGVIGLGAIGSRVAELGGAMGMTVLAWTMHPRAMAGVKPVSLDDLLRRSDVITLHVRLSPQTEGMIGVREFEQMKSGAILINTARGAIVDEAALTDALARKRIAGAGLDVFSTEPLAPAHPLTKLPNVVLTPHSAGITPEALEAGLQLAVANVRHFLAGAPANIVVAPQGTAISRKDPI